MSETPKPPTCGKCGAALSGYAPDGLCAGCLLESAFPEENPGADEPSRRTPLLAFHDYELLEEIARGGMGVVYRARQLSLGRFVAVKMILGGHLANALEMRRFREEAGTIAQLRHPNIVAIYEVGEHAGQPFFSMDLVEGRNLAQLVRDEPLPARKAAAWLKTIAEAVQYAHSRGVLHRDLKPSNVLIESATDEPRITDFGLAKRLEKDASLTVTGQVLGSPSFIPPEQAAGRKDLIGPASDVYSLGAILYQLLTVRPPFKAETMAGTLRLVAEQEPVSPRLLNASVPRDLETICLKCLEKDPGRRYATAQELADELGRFQRGEPIRARPISPVGKLWRWCGRNPALASSAGAASALLLAVAIGSPILLVRITHERDRAEQAARHESEQRIRAENLADENRWGLYAARIKVAEQAIMDGDAARAVQLLESLQPQAGQEDLRSFDWYYLWQRCHSEVTSVAGSPGLGRNVAFSADGRWLATVDNGREIHLWNATNGVEHSKLLGHTARINQVVFSPRGGLLASASQDGTVRLWDVATSKALQVLPMGTNSVGALAFSSDGKWLAVGEGLRTPSGGTPAMRYLPKSLPGLARIAVWNLETYRLERMMDAHVQGVLGLAFVPYSQRLVSSGLGQGVQLFDVTTGEVVPVKTSPAAMVFDLVAFPDGHELAAITWTPYLDSGDILILDADTLETKRRFSQPVGKVLCLAVSPDGSKLASAGADHIARLWDPRSGTELTAFHGHSSEIAALAFSADGGLLASAGADAVKVWTVDRSPVRQAIATRNSFSVAFAPDGKLFACAGRGVEVRDVARGDLVRTLPEYESFDIRVVFSPDGSVLAATGADEVIHFWDCRTWRHWQAVPPETARGKRYATTEDTDCRWTFSPDSRTLVLPNSDKVNRIWDIRTGGLVGSLPGGVDLVYSVAFSHDGRTLLTGGSALNFWNVASGQIDRTLPENAHLLRTSGNGRWLASGNRQSGIQLRDLSTMSVRATLNGHKDAIWSVAFSHDNRLVATASWDGTVKIWHVLSGQELLSVASLAGVVWSVAFAPGDRAVAFACGENSENNGQVVLLRAALDANAALMPLPPRSRPPPADVVRTRIPDQTGNKTLAAPGGTSGGKLVMAFGDPVGDALLKAPDLTGVVITFDVSNGNYTAVLTADSAKPFLDNFRVNLNLYNPDRGTNCNTSLFSSSMHDFELVSPMTNLVISGTDPKLMNWVAGDRVAACSTPFGNPSCSTLFRTSVSSLQPPSGFLVNEDQLGSFSPTNFTVIRAEQAAAQ
jgi:eukaryotic-like serine/threonine-protein kinase